MEKETTALLDSSVELAGVQRIHHTVTVGVVARAECPVVAALAVGGNADIGGRIAIPNVAERTQHIFAGKSTPSNLRVAVPGVHLKLTLRQRLDLLREDHLVDGRTFGKRQLLAPGHDIGARNLSVGHALAVTTERQRVVTRCGESSLCRGVPDPGDRQLVRRLIGRLTTVGDGRILALAVDAGVGRAGRVVHALRVGRAFRRRLATTRDRCVDATGAKHAAVSGTRVAVVAILAREIATIAQTLAYEAGVGAIGVAVAAERGPTKRLALASRRIALVVRALVAVVADLPLAEVGLGSGAYARATDALVVHGADVAIVTDPALSHSFVLATHEGVAAVHRARVAVVAADAVADAISHETMVGRCTGRASDAAVAVVRRVHAAVDAAEVVGARVAVVAVHGQARIVGLAARDHSARALAGRRIAAIAGAGVAVGAVLDASDTRALMTHVALGAGLAVVTGVTRDCGEGALAGLAGVVGAGVVVVAGQACARAGVGVRAGAGVGGRGGVRIGRTTLEHDVRIGGTRGCGDEGQNARGASKGDVQLQHGNYSLRIGYLGKRRCPMYGDSLET